MNPHFYPRFKRLRGFFLVCVSGQFLSLERLFEGGARASFTKNIFKQNYCTDCVLKIKKNVQNASLSTLFF